MLPRRNRWPAALLSLFCLGLARLAVAQNSNTCDQDSRPSLSKEYKWIPEAEHRCNIERMTHTQVLENFGPLGVPKLHPRPLVILSDPRRNKHVRTLVTRENITSSLPPNLNVTLSSSNSFSEHRRTIPLTQYLEEILKTGETTLDQKSNETWYLFGETYTEEWSKLLTNYSMPPCETCVKELVALSFGIGNRGSGVQWHVHGPGFSEALFGRKHWVLYPDKPVFDANQTSRYWMEHVYNLLSPDKLPYECTLDPGDLIYFPHQWYHATINLDPYTAFVSTFTTEHL
jgi:hypothetical protein